MSLNDKRCIKNSGPRWNFLGIAIVCILFAAIIAVAAIPFIQKSNRPPLHLNFADAQLSEIKANLKMIEAAKEEWGHVNKKAMNDAVSLMDVTQYLKYNISPSSVIGEYYALSTIGTHATAVLPTNVTLNGKTGPFTLTSFD